MSRRFEKYNGGHAINRKGSTDSERIFAAVFSALILTCGVAVATVVYSVRPFIVYDILLYAYRAVFDYSEPPNPSEIRREEEGVLSPLPSENKIETWVDYTDFTDEFIKIEKTDDCLPVISTTLTASSTMMKIGNIYVNNESGKEITAEARTVQLTDAQPQILIYHTHGTECYNPGCDFYGDGSYSVNTTDTEKNVVKIGEAVTDILKQRGIGVIHLTEMFDKDDYLSAYDKSLEAIEKILEDNPSIQIIIDIHRDTVIQSDGTKLSTVTTTDCGKTAQMMIVIGSGRKNAEVPDWNENLSFALGICEKINEKYPSVLRPILIRSTRYNQHLSINSILLEVGTCGNTLTEAVNASVIFANCLADMLINISTKY